MGRSRRLTYRNATHHVTMRCNNKEFLFEERSLRLFLDLLRESSEKYGVRLFNYCLMTNHVHVLFRVKADDVLSPFMHRLANVFAKRFNLIRGRKGHLWEGRFRSTIVEASSYFLPCMAYIDLNPVRAGIVQKPGDYQWCGHRYLEAEDESIIDLHRIYLGLGKERRARYRAYMKLLEKEAAREPYSLAGTLFVGSERFTQRLQKRFGIVNTARVHVQRVDLEGGIRAIELLGGGSRE
jgi:putative transposase